MVKNTRKVKIKHMEDKITHLATYPKDFQKYKDLLEENNREISLMRNQIKVPRTHPMEMVELAIIEK